MFFFRFSPGIALSAKGCPRPKWPRKIVFYDFPPLWVRSAKTENIKKLRNIREKLLGRPDFSPKSAPSTRTLCFRVSAQALNLSKCPRPKRAKIPLNHRFRPAGVRQKNCSPESCGKPSRIAWQHFLSAKSAPSTRKLHFSVFGPGPEFLCFVFLPRP